MVKGVMHKALNGEYGYKLCEPFGDDKKEKKLASVSEMDKEVTCKWCLNKINGAARKMKR